MSRAAWGRDVRALRRLGEEIVVQCDHWRANTDRGHADDIRALVMDGVALKAAKVTRRMRRRFERERAAP